MSALLFAAQAAGFIFNEYQQGKAAETEDRLYNIGHSLEQHALQTELAGEELALSYTFESEKISSQLALAALELNKTELNLRIQQEELSSLEQSTFNLEQLRETMASQRALFAARGQMAGVGTAGTISNKSIHNYNKDEEARRMSMDFRRLAFESRGKLLASRGEAVKARTSLLEVGTTSQKKILGYAMQGQLSSMNLANINRKYGQKARRTAQTFENLFGMVSFNQLMSPFLSGSKAKR